ncbi:hypothetical protein [Providencia sp. PROV076]|uniref:hypothetical protein n=1 Tax=Providencia sp. PROV076 TaxID=2949798 RepID=UPI00234BEF82|nr:hypothetical protein [Providencia sp. PROV076]
MDKSRQQFEEWRSKNKSSTINLFEVWQASRESLEVELPDIGTNLLACSHEEFIDGFNDAISEIKTILISNGVKIKNGN